MVEVENETSTVQKASFTHLLPYLSTPEQVQIYELPADIIEKYIENQSND